MVFQVLGVATAAWLGMGLVVGIAFVATRPALFFSAGFRWGVMARTVLMAVPYWPPFMAQVVWGDRNDEREYERDRERESRRAREMYRFQLRSGDWYRDVLGMHRKWHVDAFGRACEPDEIGPESGRIREADFACRNGEWQEGECPLCGAPEKGASVCGMLGTEFAGVPQYVPEARLMRHAPDEGFVLAVANPDTGHGSIADRPNDRFHEVSFRKSGPGKGTWVDRDGRVVDGLFGWWPLPSLRDVQSSDGLEEPHRWNGDEPPEAYDSRKAWDEVMGRGGRDAV
jgi:catechol 2,3-dioxygenase-like lactoylglutathione lyase family enzyme